MKLKTKRTVAKRFSITASGLVVGKFSKTNHNLRKYNKKYKRQRRAAKIMSPFVSAKVRKMIVS